MPRTNVILNKFTGGEIAPDTWGRTDADQWPAMVEQMRNTISDPRGGAKRRSGLHYVLPTKFPQVNSRLIPFVFSREQSYMLEFGDYYVRFFRDQGYVEDVGNVTTYLGDGTSTSFVYPYPDTEEANIEVLDENGDVVPDTEYTTTAIVPGTNYMQPFSDAGWNVDIESTGEPWVKNAAEITSPDGHETVMGAEDLPVPLGGAYQYKVNIAGFQYTKSTKNDSNAELIPLVVDGPYISVASITAEKEVNETVTINYDVSFEDVSGTRTSNFFWEIRVNSTIIAEGVENAVGSPALRLQGQTTYSEQVYIDDVISLQVMATGNHLQSQPAVAGSVNPTSLTAEYLTNTNAKLQWEVVSQGTSTEWQSADPVVGETILIDTNETATAPAPYTFAFRCQDGLQVTLDTPSLVFNNEGWVITFNTAPPQGSIRLIRDKSLTPDETIRHTRLMNDLPFADVPIFEIQSPFGVGELEDLHFAQANDVMIFATDTQRPWRLTRYNPYDWRFEQPTFIGAPWEGESNYYLGDGTKTVYSYDFASNTDDDIKIYFNDDLQTSGYTIDHGAETVTFSPAPPDGMRIVIVGVNTYNPLEGYPRTVAFFQERLYFGGTVSKPQTLWGSRSADFYYFAVPDTEAEGAAVLAPDDAVEYTIAAYTHEAIEWLSSERVLIIGTSATEHRLAPDQYIATDRLPTVSRMSAYGGAHIMPAYMGNLTVFVQTVGNQVRTFEQSTQSVIEKWDSIELDWMAGHLTAPKVKQIGYALNPDSILFMVTLDGDFLTMTYEPGMGEQGEMGWAKHDTDGNFKSCAVIPEDEHDEIWAIVEREIDGLGYRYVEFFDKEVFTDSTLTYPPDDGTSYPPLQSVGGLVHLEGKTVTIVADGSTHPDLTVENGQVELNDSYQNIEIGLKYIPLVKLQRFAMASEPSDLQGQQGRWVEVWLRMVESAYPLVDGVRTQERRAVTPMNEPEPVVTGDVKVYHIGFDRNKQLTISQDLPLPMHITAVYGVLEVHAG